MEKVLITQEGLEKLEQELKQLKNVERPQITKAIQVARDFGDLSENADYSAAKEKQSFIEGRITFLESLLSTVEVAKITHDSSDNNKSLEIRFGATVTLEDLSNSKILQYRIVSEYESDVKGGKLSINSPMAKAMIGATAQDVIQVSTNNKQYSIIKIEYL